MRTAIVGVALAMVAGTAWGQFAGLTDAEVIEMTSIEDPARAAQTTAEEWFAFSMPALEGTRSPCCWKGNWDHQRESGCSLERQHQSYGTRSDSPITENLIVFAQLKNGEVDSMRVVGEHCPVQGNGARINWLGPVNDTASLDWLETVARSDDQESVRHSALYAMALHQEDEVNERLFDIARDAEDDLQTEAIFWLGEARGEQGFNRLERLLSELPEGETRQEINFAVAQVGTPAAFDLLTRISRTDADPEQRANALFWLADEFPDRAGDILLKAISSESDSEVLEQAVFAISQLPDEMSGPMLLDLARDNQQSHEVRRQALFWLAQSDDEKTIAALTDLLTQ